MFQNHGEKPTVLRTARRAQTATFQAYGGAGSGWTAEGGHVPGSQGGSGEKRVTATVVHDPQYPGRATVHGPNGAYKVSVRGSGHVYVMDSKGKKVSEHSSKDDAIDAAKKLAGEETEGKSEKMSDARKDALARMDKKTGKGYLDTSKRKGREVVRGTSDSGRRSRPNYRGDK